MGIPSYFSHLVKNHSEILKTIDNLNKNIHNFYLDSNSIIYDCVRSIPRLENETDNDFVSGSVNAWRMRGDGTG